MMKSLKTANTVILAVIYCCEHTWNKLTIILIFWHIHILTVFILYAGTQKGPQIQLDRQDSIIVYTLVLALQYSDISIAYSEIRQNLSISVQIIMTHMLDTLLCCYILVIIKIILNQFIRRPDSLQLNCSPTQMRKKLKVPHSILMTQLDSTQKIN